MRVGQNYFPKSSFLSVEKDLMIIINKLLENQSLCKLLYYNSKDCLLKQDLTQNQKLEMINKQLKIIPQYQINTECPTFIIVSLDNYKPNETNPEFRDCTVNFDILCHPDHWMLNDFKLRPYKIAGEIDAMLNKKKLTGIGELNLISGDTLVLAPSLMGITLIYSAIHGSEDNI